MNENKDAMSDQLPDRLSSDPRSPYYNEEILSRDVGIRFKGVEKTNVEASSKVIVRHGEGWVQSVTAGAAKDRYGNHLVTLISESLHAARSSRIFARRTRPDFRHPT